MASPNTDTVMIYRNDLLERGGGGGGVEEVFLHFFGSSVGCIMAAGRLLRRGGGLGVAYHLD